MVSDRLAIIRNGTFPEILLSTQLLLTCNTNNDGCKGGALLHTLQYIHDIGIPDETCTAYVARGRDSGQVCLRSVTCSTCGADGSCEIVPERHMYRYVIYGFGVISGEEKMMQEIYQKGPIVCEMMMPSKTSPVGDPKAPRNHATVVAGWRNKDYLIRNNWGITWQGSGWADIGPRGSNPYRMEEYCVWADPRFPEFEKLLGTIPKMRPPYYLWSEHGEDMTDQFPRTHPIIGKHQKAFSIFHPKTNETVVPKPTTKAPPKKKEEDEYDERSHPLDERKDEGHHRSFSSSRLSVEQRVADEGVHAGEYHDMDALAAMSKRRRLEARTTTERLSEEEAEKLLETLNDMPDSDKVKEEIEFLRDDIIFRDLRESAIRTAATADPETNECSYDFTKCTTTECLCKNGFKRHEQYIQLDDGEEHSCFTCVPKVPAKLNVLTEPLPTSIDWRNHKGQSFVSLTRNQHLPTYCGSCWAFSGTSALADRFQIVTNNTYPLLLSPQAMVNCNAGGTCDGGSAYFMYANIYANGAPPDTCRHYSARNGMSDWPQTCPPEARCIDCTGPYMSDCKPIFNYPLYYVADFGKVFGPHQMKIEIMRGPIVCGIMATDQMETYTGGLYFENKTDLSINHDISVLGWGSMKYGPHDHFYEYWVMRNSWGSFWGEFGYMRMLMYRDNNAIEKSCTWATPGKIEKAKTPKGYKWKGDFDYGKHEQEGEDPDELVP